MQNARFMHVLEHTSTMTSSTCSWVVGCIVRAIIVHLVTVHSDKKNTCTNFSACEPNGSRLAISKNMGKFFYS